MMLVHLPRVRMHIMDDAPSQLPMLQLCNHIWIEDVVTY
jgi:hypothetical protein